MVIQLNYIIMQRVATLQIYYAKITVMYFVVVTPQSGVMDGSPQTQNLV